MRKTQTPSIHRLRSCARPGVRPNVLIVLLDDVGFGASSAFGGGLGKGGRASLYVDGKKAGALQGARLCSIHN